MGSANNLAAQCFGFWDGVFLRSPVNSRVCDVPRATAAADTTTLYILAEAAEGSAVSPALYDRVLTVIEQAYLASEGTTPEALDAALRSANEMLYQRNLRADAAHEAAMRLQAAVTEDRTVTVGRLGAACLCGALGGRPLLIPEDSPWLGSASRPVSEPPAGQSGTCAPKLYSATLGDRDALALVTASLVRAMPVWDLVAALAQGADEARSRLGPLGADDNWSTIVLTAGTVDLSCLQADAAALIPPEELALGLTTPADGASASRGEDRTISSPPEEVPEESIEVESLGEDEGDLKPVPNAVNENASRAAPETDETTPETALRAADGVDPVEDELWSGADESAWAEVSTPASATADVTVRYGLAPTVSRMRRSGAQWPRLKRVVHKLEDVLVRVLPDKVPQRPASSPAPERGITWKGRTLILLAMAIPIVMLTVVIVTRMHYEEARQDEFGDYQARAQSLYDQATTSGDLAATRQGLADALIAADEGLSIAPGDEMLMSLKRRIEHKMDEINAVERIYTFYKLADLDADATGSGDASRIVVEGIDLYVLHRGSDRVTRYLMNDVGDALQPVGGNPTLLRTGEVVDGTRVGDLVDMTWMRAGGQRSLDTFVMLDRSGTMYAYDPQVGIDALPVADADTWIKPEAIGGYFGNLYVLDPLLNAILKYVPTDNAYTSPPTSYLNPMLGVDLTGAVDMAVDGNMYVLFANGDVAKFYEGERVAFTLNGLPSGMASPSAIFVSGEQEPTAEGFVYIADTGNQRVLQFDKNGNYVRQLKARLDGTEMQSLRGLWVDEASERILLVSDDALWYAKLPALGAR